MRMREIVQGGAEMLEAVATRLKAWNLKNEGRVNRGQQNPLGQEIPDPEPLVLPLNPHSARRIDEMRLHLQAVSQLAAQQGMETFEESEVFDFGEDREPRSPFFYATDNEIEQYATEVLGAGYRLNAAGDAYVQDPQLPPPAPAPEGAVQPAPSGASSEPAGEGKP